MAKLFLLWQTTNMNTLKISELKTVVGTKLFSIHGYIKSNGEESKINGQFGVKKYLTGGINRGYNPQKHIIIHKPKIGYRQLIIDKLDGCTLKANGQVYQLVKD